MDLKTIPQAYEPDEYSWTYIKKGYGSAYKKTCRHLAKTNSFRTTLGIFAKASDWVNPPLGPPSENWLRESNRFNSRMKTYDRGKKDAHQHLRSAHKTTHDTARII